ncbi:MAG: hypothetical protein P8X67_11125 [Syntrophobacterales bacterium]|jgi:hypothetical protein
MKPIYDQPLARIFHEFLSRDHEDGRANGQPSRVPRDWFPYLNDTSQGPTPEDAWKDRPYPCSQQVIHAISRLEFQPGAG